MSRAKRPRLSAPPLWKHNFGRELIGRWPLKSLSCQSSEGDGSHSMGREQYLSFHCRSAVRDCVRSSGSLDNELWTLTDWQLTGCFLISYLQNWSTCDWLTLNVLLSTSGVVFQLHNYWFFIISWTQCRTSHIEVNTQGISVLLLQINPFSAVHNSIVAAKAW